MIQKLGIARVFTSHPTAYTGRVVIGQLYVSVEVLDSDVSFQVWIPHHEVTLIDTLVPEELYDTAQEAKDPDPLGPVPIPHLHKTELRGEKYDRLHDEIEEGSGWDLYNEVMGVQNER